MYITLNYHLALIYQGFPTIMYIFPQTYIIDKSTFDIDKEYVYFKTILFTYTAYILFHNVHYYSSHIVEWNVHYHIPFIQNLSNCEFSLMTRLIDFFSDIFHCNGIANSASHDNLPYYFDINISNVPICICLVCPFSL